MINSVPVIVGIATIEERKESLVDTLDSLEDQVDEIVLYANDWQPGTYYLEKYLRTRFCTGIFESGHGDKGDISKFWPAIFRPDEEGECYFLTCDDDLIYPPDYVQKMIESVERYDRKAACSFHGKKYFGPVESYYRTFNDHIKEFAQEHHREPMGDGWKTENYKCLGTVPDDMPATVLGTGCAGWHSSLLDLSLEDFPVPNMADIWFSKKLNDLDIPRITLAHEKDWIIHTDKIDTERDTIYARHFFSDEIQTEVFNSVDWRL